MPQIANQDYNIIRPAYADTIPHDAEALGQLAGHIERGTIFDVILFYIDGDGGKEYFRPTGLTIPEDSWPSIDYFDSYLSENTYIELRYTPTQYSGLAAVQRACELTKKLPVLTKSGDDDYLTEDNSSLFICVNGCLVLAESDDSDKIVSLTVTDQKAESGTYADISEDDLQKLIGLSLD